MFFLTPTTVQYCYMLMTIEKMWTYDGASRGRLVTNNMMNLMLNIIKPLSLFLVKQKLENGKNAAPPFNFYKFDGEMSAFEKLKELTNDALQEYIGNKDLIAVKSFVDALLDLTKLK